MVQITDHQAVRKSLLQDACFTGNIPENRVAFSGIPPVFIEPVCIGMLAIDEFSAIGIRIVPSCKYIASQINIQITIIVLVEECRVRSVRIVIQSVLRSLVNKYGAAVFIFSLVDVKNVLPFTGIGADR